MRATGWSVVFIVAASAPSTSAAADWKPERNVEIIVAVSPGGGQDKTARLLQKILAERHWVDVPVTVTNKPGGGGTIGWTYLTQRPADGHFLQIGNTTVLTNQLFGRTTIS